MPTRNIVLTEQQAKFVEQMVASGRYQNASEVLREGLRLVFQREQEDAMRLEAWRMLPVVNTTNIVSPHLPDKPITLLSRLS